MWPLASLCIYVDNMERSNLSFLNRKHPRCVRLVEFFFSLSICGLSLLWELQICFSSIVLWSTLLAQHQSLIHMWETDQCCHICAFFLFYWLVGRHSATDRWLQRFKIQPHSRHNWVDLQNLPCRWAFLLGWREVISSEGVHLAGMFVRMGAWTTLWIYESFAVSRPDF